MNKKLPEHILTKYLVQIYSNGEWKSVNGTKKKEYAIRLANKPYYTNNSPTRVIEINWVAIHKHKKTEPILIHKDKK